MKTKQQSYSQYIEAKIYKLDSLILQAKRAGQAEAYELALMEMDELEYELGQALFMEGAK